LTSPRKRVKTCRRWSRLSRSGIRFKVVPGLFEYLLLYPWRGGVAMTQKILHSVVILDGLKDGRVVLVTQYASDEQHGEKKTRATEGAFQCVFGSILTEGYLQQRSPIVLWHSRKDVVVGKQHLYKCYSTPIGFSFSGWPVILRDGGVEAAVMGKQRAAPLPPDDARVP
jgi:hypothetical protein